VEHPREEGIYKLKKVTGIPRKVVQDFFLTENAVCGFSERTQTNLLRFLMSVPHKQCIQPAICDQKAPRSGISYERKS
jgi:hypothetical protein